MEKPIGGLCMEKLETLIQTAVVEHLGIDADKYAADKTLEEMGADDLDVIGLLMHIEETLKVPQFPDEYFPALVHSTRDYGLAQRERFC
jgi:acyl carrier protein